MPILMGIDHDEKHREVVSSLQENEATIAELQKNINSMQQIQFLNQSWWILFHAFHLMVYSKNFE